MDTTLMFIHSVDLGCARRGFVRYLNKCGVYRYSLVESGVGGESVEQI